MSEYRDTKPLVPDQLLAPGVYDDRQLAYVRTLDAGLKSIDIQAFIMSDADTVDAKLLPFLVREFSLQEFISTDLPDQFVRRFIKKAHELHAKKGYVEGARLGLRMLGVEVKWTQWWEETPKAAHNTHTVTAYINEHIFADQPTVLNEKVQRACLKIIDATKRWSQDINFQLGVGFKNETGALSAARSNIALKSHGDAMLPVPGNDMGLDSFSRQVGHASWIGQSKLPELGNHIGAVIKTRAVSILKLEGSLVT